MLIKLQLNLRKEGLVYLIGNVVNELLADTQDIFFSTSTVIGCTSSQVHTCASKPRTLAISFQAKLLVELSGLAKRAKAVQATISIPLRCSPLLRCVFEIAYWWHVGWWLIRMHPQMLEMRYVWVTIKDKLEHYLSRAHLLLRSWLLEPACFN